MMLMVTKISDLSLNDLNEVMIHEHELFTTPFSKEDYQFEIVSNPFAFYKKIEINNELVAWGGIHVLFEDSHLITIAVVKKYQHQGYGKILLKHFIALSKDQNATKMLLEVREKNQIAIHLYESLGFRFNRLRKNYYPDDNGIEMILDWGNQ